MGTRGAATLPVIGTTHWRIVIGCDDVSMTTTDSATEITNLLYRYAENIDAGRLDDAAALFRHARIRVGADRDLLDGSGLLDMWRATVKIHPCGTPRTKHVTTNPLLDIDAESGRATCRSYYTVLQSTPDLPLQVIVAGRYHDEFEYVDGQWRFTFRDYTMLDFVGDTSEHLGPGRSAGTPAPDGGSPDSRNEAVVAGVEGTDHAAVTEVVNRYAYALDDRDWPLLDEVFAEDAVARYGRADSRAVTGRTAIVQVIRSMLDGCGPSQHLLATHIVTADGDTATSACKARVYHYGAGAKASLEPYECFGVYRHTLRRTAAGWRVTELLFDVQHTVGDIRIVQPG